MTFSLEKDTASTTTTSILEEDTASTTRTPSLEKDTASTTRTSSLGLNGATICLVMDVDVHFTFIVTVTHSVTTMVHIIYVITAVVGRDVRDHLLWDEVCDMRVNILKHCMVHITHGITGVAGQNV